MPKTAEEVFESMNCYGSKSKPFLFGIDFDVNHGFFFDMHEAADHGVLYSINGINNVLDSKYYNEPVQLVKHPIPKSKYQLAFDLVQHNLRIGNSYLANLTFPTRIELKIGLEEIFTRSRARYRLLFQDSFVVFSPEIFVQIESGTIRSFPMKGTIDASVENAESVILRDEKETAEHNTIVDLIRNDLSMVANDVSVERFRYIETLTTNQKTLLQVSSEISGKLPKAYPSHLGGIFQKLLPAGSISGAPKKKTIEIIKQAEAYDRGFYTGVFGYFDGQRLDSGVMIRFIKNDKGRLTFFSGGGITVKSEADKEYNELIDKVYVPFI